MEKWWNNDYHTKMNNLEKNLLPCHFNHHESHLKPLELNPGICSEKPALKHLSHGTAILH
jgi:hypothetical protein